ncbi:hypothetical protein R3W88_013238 [Solanum pinnatisectum]|uniref:Uncharacterized protein n=1 Tax=Solanum pinnatisectum TaxID=50273 RepID=A0AAV9LER8_9SOLN|nr:hypothetical protein R3W88_013238 [Solanum pinnatisectum]
MDLVGISVKKRGTEFCIDKKSNESLLSNDMGVVLKHMIYCKCFCECLHVSCMCIILINLL